MDALHAIIDAIALGSIYALVAMGITLIFGVMRLINFAHGEMITAGAYSFVVTTELPLVLRIIVMFATVIAFSLAIELGLRPLRNASPAALLVTTFAFSFLLQSIFLLVWSSQGDNPRVLSKLNEALSVGDLKIRWVTFAAIGVGAILLVATALFLNRTSLGLQMRAAAHDFRTARILGVRANNVIMLAFLIAGVLAAAATPLLVVQRPLATPTFGFSLAIPALVGVVVGGMDRIVTGTLGGFLIGFVTVILGNYLESGRVFLTSVVFALVIVVLVLRPNGVLSRRNATVERV
ncbi:MAG: branched-chain amino acid ABC transporter permease [Gaiellaceae bacterium]